MPNAMTPPPAPNGAPATPPVQGWYDIVGQVPGGRRHDAVPAGARRSSSCRPRRVRTAQSSDVDGRANPPDPERADHGTPAGPVLRPAARRVLERGHGGWRGRLNLNDVKVGNVSQFVQSGDVPGDLFSDNRIDTFVRFSPVQTAMDFVFVVTYIGLNESGCPFFGAVLGTAAV